MGQNQSDQQASIRAVTGTAWTYEGDWHALFDQAGIASGDYNGRLLAWINQSMGASYAELNGAMSAFAASQSAPSWNEMGTFTPGSAPVAAWDASTSTLAQLAVLATHTRTSLATMFDSTGKLTYAPNNLLTQSNTFSNAAWVKSSATVSSGVADPLGGTDAFTVTATGANGQIYQPVTVSGGTSTNFIESIWIRRRTGSGTVKIYKPDGTTQVVVAVNSTWQQFYAVGVGLSTTAYNTVLLATSGDAIDIYAATLSAVTYETTPRTADQVITTSAAYYGPRVDVEESRTNLLPQSGNFASSWSFFGSGRSTDGTLGPDGATLAAKISAAAGSAEHEIYNTAAVSVTVGIPLTGSIYVKKGNHRYVWVNLENSNTTGAIAVFDLDNPSAATQTWASGTATYGSSDIINIGSGWYRISVTGVLQGASTYMTAGFAGAATGNSTVVVEPSWTAMGTEYGYFFGAQLEAGSFATSYIPTAYDPATLAVRGLLVEESRTNTALQSATMASGWNGQGVSSSTDGTLWLDGGTAQKRTAQATTDVHSTYSTATVGTTAGSTYSLSWNVKAGTYSKVYLCAGDGTRNAFATFDISGTADISASQASGASHTGISGSGKYLGSGWFRLTLTFTASAGSVAGFLEVGIVQNLTGNTTNGFGEILWTAAGTETYYIGQPQYEVGAFPTSFIPTAAAAVTRASDALTAASLTTNPAIIQYRSISTGTRARKVINPWSGISSETDEWIEAIRIYPSGTGASYLNTKLTVDGPW